MKFNVDLRDPLHLTTFIFTSISIVITVSLVFLTLLQTLMSQAITSDSSTLAIYRTTSKHDNVQQHGSAEESFADSILTDQSTYYDFFMKKLFRNLNNKVCNPSNSTVAQLTRDKYLIPVHSHNDYWRTLPVFEALSFGYNSIEADIWKVDSSDELLVGHNHLFLDPKRTLNHLYLQNIVNLLDEVNCGKDSGDEKSGLFFNSPESTTYLYIDIKTQATETYQKFINSKLIQEMVAKNYLTHYSFDDKTVHSGPLTLIITGNVPVDFIRNEQSSDPFKLQKRVAFIDAPLNGLENYDSTISVMASGSLRVLLEKEPISVKNGLSDSQMAKIAKFITKSHKLGIKTRIWDTPNWPVSHRNMIWQQLIQIGLDYINVDDLKDAQQLF